MSVLDQLNLRPQEKRILVVVAFLIFVVLNWMFVRPLFGQWAVAKDDLLKARRTLEKYQGEIAKAPTYQNLEKKLRSSGSDVLSEELQLQRIVDQHATAAGVAVSRYAPGVRVTPGRTNQFFEDQGLTIDFNTYSTNLVEFLVGLASGNNMIRVQEMNLKPDGTGTKLSGNILFVASYQKKAPSRTTTTRTTPSGAATTPAQAAPTKSSTNKAWAAPATKTVTNPPATRPSTNSPKPVKK